MGSTSHHPQGPGNGHPDKLPVPHDDLHCHHRMSTAVPFFQISNSWTQTLAPAVNIKVIKVDILPMINQLIEDRIPNIRFNVAKSYGVLINVLRQLPAEGTLTDMKPGEAPTGPSPMALDLIQKHIIPNLEKLRGDQDRDVRYYAEQALGNAEDFMHTSP